MLRLQLPLTPLTLCQLAVARREAAVVLAEEAAAQRLLEVEVVVEVAVADVVAPAQAPDLMGTLTVDAWSL